MPFKTITITESAYRKFARAKRAGESFTDVIDRVFGGPSALDLVGLLDDEAGEGMAKESARIRRSLNERVRRKAQSMRP